MTSLNNDNSLLNSVYGSDRIPQLDGLRALAFLAVFLNHSVKAPFLWVGVDLFFVLSGYLITKLLLRESQQRSLAELLRLFYMRRAFRILIPYIVMMTLATAFVDSTWLNSWPYYLTFSQNFAVAFSKTQGVFVPLWSLAVEEQFYLAWPFLIFFLAPKRLVKICIMLMCFAFLMRASASFLFTRYLITFTLTPFRMDLLASGAIVALVEHRIIHLRCWNSAAKFICIASTISFLTLAITEPSFRAKTNSLLFNTIGYSLVMIICLSTLIVSLTDSRGLRYRILTWPPLRFLGKISFMCYMAHEPILKLANAHGDPVRSGLALIAVIIFSSLTWYTFEERAIRFGRQLTSPLTRTRVNEAVGRVA